jgi:sulfite exporter TauE/SafE
MDLSLIVAATVGLLSALHCVGMCGGIVGALSLSLPAHIRDSLPRLVAFVLAYNLGRIASYALLGALFGGMGSAMLGLTGMELGHRILKGVSALVMAGIGLYLGGWLPQLARLEGIGVPLWRHLQPLGRRLLPVSSLTRAALFGAIWGWLPCGLVYTALVWSSAAGSAWQGAGYMAAFGAGTLPATVGAGILTASVARLRQIPYLRQVAGISVVAFALLSLALPGSQPGNADAPAPAAHAAPGRWAE